MDRQVKKIKAALEQISNGDQQKDDAEIHQALTQIDSSLEQLKGHPRFESIYAALAEAAEHMSSEEGMASKVLHRLNDELATYEDAHPGVTLLVGRLANALAVYGL